MRVEGINNAHKELVFSLYKGKDDTGFLSILLKTIESADLFKAEKISNHEAFLSTLTLIPMPNTPYLLIPHTILNSPKDLEKMISDSYMYEVSRLQASNNSFSFDSKMENVSKDVSSSTVTGALAYTKPGEVPYEHPSASWNWKVAVNSLGNSQDGTKHSENPQTHIVKDNGTLDNMAGKDLYENRNSSDMHHRRTLSVVDNKVFLEENNTAQLSNSKQVVEGNDQRQAKKGFEELPKEVSYNIEQREKLIDNKVVNHVESRSKEYQMVEHKYVRVSLEETDISIRVVRDSIRVGVDLKSDLGYIFRGEINRLVESLNSIGFRLEALQINGTLLYSDSRPEDRREERNRQPQYQKVKANNSHERFELSV